MPEFNPYEAPVSTEVNPRSKGRRDVGPGLWSDGNFLVARDRAEFPDRCVKCNESAEGLRLKRVMRWHPSGYYLLILLCTLAYAIVATVVSKTVTLEVGICPAHRRRRRKQIASAWLLGLGGVGLILLFGAVAGGPRGGPEENPGLALLILAGVVMILTGLILGVIASKFLTIERIDKDKIARIKGACPEFLETLPEYPWA